MRAFVLHTIAVPLLGATCFLVTLAAAANQTWGVTTAISLAVGWCAVTATLALANRVTWTTIALVSVLPPTAVALFRSGATTGTALLLGIGRNAMYALAKLRCVFLGCCNVPRSAGEMSWLRTFHLGRCEAIVAVLLVATGALQLLKPGVAAFPLILAHGTLRIGADQLRTPWR